MHVHRVTQGHGTQGQGTARSARPGLPPPPWPLLMHPCAMHSPHKRRDVPCGHVRTGAEEGRPICHASPKPCVTSLCNPSHAPTDSTGPKISSRHTRMVGLTSANTCGCVGPGSRSAGSQEKGHRRKPAVLRCKVHARCGCAGHARTTSMHLGIKWLVQALTVGCRKKPLARCAALTQKQ